jgi:hypothetical protein
VLKKYNKIHDVLEKPFVMFQVEKLVSDPIVNRHEITEILLKMALNTINLKNLT